ncbi:hypothetical protein BDW69DRAFT_172648 [Aspergillus filifer]
MTHGDSSTRNILLRNSSSETTTAAENTNAPSPDYSLAIIDWEISCYASFTRDVANILSDLYMQIHFTEPEEARETSRSQFFLNGLYLLILLSAKKKFTELSHKSARTSSTRMLMHHRGTQRNRLRSLSGSGRD